MENLISFLGFWILILIAWALTYDRGKIKWRPVIGGVILQFAIALMVFCVPPARSLFLFFSDVFTKTINYSRDGIIFVFGQLGAENSPQGLILAFQVFPFIVIFSSLMGFLYYIRVIPWIIKMMARFLTKTLGTSAAESLCAAANVFTGIESVTAIRPYIAGMTRSELFIVLVTGMSTVASSVMVIYVNCLQKSFPAIAGHLMSASLLSVPAAFVISKLMVPETGRPETSDAATCDMHCDNAGSVTESFIIGGNNGAKLAVGVIVTLMSFIGILGIIRGLFTHFAGNAVTIEALLGYAFYPFSFLMGIPWNEIPEISRILGERLILTEVPAYFDLAKFAAEGGSGRSVLITSYALCGFAHIASMAIFVGGTAALAPSQTTVLSKIAVRALIAATLVTLMTGCVAGIFYYGQSGVLR